MQPDHALVGKFQAGEGGCFSRPSAVAESHSSLRLCPACPLLSEFGAAPPGDLKARRQSGASGG